jgi:hypothetical protein
METNVLREKKKIKNNYGTLSNHCTMLAAIWKFHSNWTFGHMGKYGGHMGKNGKPIYDLGLMGISLELNSEKKWRTYGNSPAAKWSGVQPSLIATIMPSENPRIVKYLMRENSIPHESQVCGVKRSHEWGILRFSDSQMAESPLLQFRTIAISKLLILAKKSVKNYKLGRMAEFLELKSNSVILRVSRTWDMENSQQIHSTTNSPKWQ